MAVSARSLQAAVIFCLVTVGAVAAAGSTSAKRGRPVRQGSCEVRHCAEVPQCVGERDVGP
jgi:hypothetical protein